jgi:catalase-peroxidase
VFGLAEDGEDVWETAGGSILGSEKEWLGDKRYTGRGIGKSLAAVQMGLIYVNPEGPNGKPDPEGMGFEVRETFARDGHDMIRNVALIAVAILLVNVTEPGRPRLWAERKPRRWKQLGWDGKVLLAAARRGYHWLRMKAAGKANRTQWDMGY